RADRAGIGPVRPQAVARADVRRLVRRRELFRDAAIARAVLWVTAQPRARADPLSRRLLATGVGQRDPVHPDRGVARIAIRPCCKRNSPAQPPPAAIFGRAGAAKPATQAIQRGPQGAPSRQRSLGGTSRAARAHPVSGGVRPTCRPCRTHPWRTLTQLTCPDRFGVCAWSGASVANLITVPSRASVGGNERMARNMCRNIRTLYNFQPPANDEEIRASALQFVRKLSGSARPSKANQQAFTRAVEQVTQATRELLDSLVTDAPPRDRDVEAAKARARVARRFPPSQPRRGA